VAFLTARSYRLFFPLKPEFIAVHCGFISFTITDPSFTPTLSSYFIEAGETAHAFGFKTTFLRAIDDDNGSGLSIASSPRGSKPTGTTATIDWPE
jgi:hypothetical protein